MPHTFAQSRSEPPVKRERLIPRSRYSKAVQSQKIPICVVSYGARRQSAFTRVLTAVLVQLEAKLAARSRTPGDKTATSIICRETTTGIKIITLSLDPGWITIAVQVGPLGALLEINGG